MNNQTAFIRFLEIYLRDKPLPGLASQMILAPAPVHPHIHSRMVKAPPGARLSSVLVLLYPNDSGKLQLVLTLRSELIRHGGQLCFPGGRMEKEETPEETALREANEEIGLDGKQVKIIGRLSEIYVEVSNNRIIPVVGFLADAPAFHLSSGEVAEVFSVDLDVFLDEQSLIVGDWILHDLPFKVPYWNIHRVPLWGATAMMLNELLELYNIFREEV